MSYGQGTVYRRGGQWWVRYWDNGKEKRRPAGPTRDGAMRKLKLWHGEAATGRLVSADAESVTLREIFDMLAADRRLNKRKSVAPVARLLDHFGDDCRVLTLTHDVLARYADERIRGDAEHIRGDAKRWRRGAKPATVRNSLLALGRAWRLAHRAGRLPMLPCLPTIGVRNARKGFFAPDEVADLLRELPEYLRGYVETLAITGWRRSEVAGLRWQNVDWEAGELKLEGGTTKNDDGRTYPFKAHPRLAEVLGEQREATSRFEREHGSIVEWVFHHDGHKLNGWNYRAWRRACAAAGVPGRLMHDLRRSAARDLIRSGVPEGVTMKLCGWRTRSVLARYDIVSTTDLEAAVGRLAEYRARAGSSTGRVIEMTGRGKS